MSTCTYAYICMYIHITTYKQNGRLLGLIKLETPIIYDMMCEPIAIKWNKSGIKKNVIISITCGIQENWTHRSREKNNYAMLEGGDRNRAHHRESFS